MPGRIEVSKELAEIFKVIGHPDRIRIVEELRLGESDVNNLASKLDITGPRVSQHLNQLRVHRIASERREGRRHVYSLLQPEIATWIVNALDFVEGRGTTIPKSKINSVRRLWTQETETSSIQSDHYQSGSLNK